MRVSTNPIAVPRAFAVASVALFLVIAATGSGPAAAQSGSLAGVYDGGQMEIAAALELKPDGRFNYALSYGALDEGAAGRWTASGDRVLLSSNPVVAPRPTFREACRDNISTPWSRAEMGGRKRCS